MNRSDFLSKFSPDNPDHRQQAAKVVCEPPITSKLFHLPPLYSGVNLIEGPQDVTRHGYECPRAVFGFHGWEWRFSVEYFDD